jgi:hypothetical protein
MQSARVSTLRYSGSNKKTLVLKTRSLPVRTSSLDLSGYVYNSLPRRAPIKSTSSLKESISEIYVRVHTPRGTKNIPSKVTDSLSAFKVKIATEFEQEQYSRMFFFCNDGSDVKVSICDDDDFQLALEDGISERDGKVHIYLT